MGLDMYLKAKTKLLGIGEKEMTGACGGLFPFAPKSNGMIEIGYWRKAYNVAEVILSKVDFNDGEDNCVDFYLSKEDCENILRYAEDMIYENNYEDDWEKQDWKDTIEIFKKALSIYNLDQDAEIYYYQWR